MSVAKAEGKKEELKGTFIDIYFIYTLLAITSANRIHLTCPYILLHPCGRVFLRPFENASLLANVSLCCSPDLHCIVLPHAHVVTEFIGFD